MAHPQAWNPFYVLVTPFKVESLYQGTLKLEWIQESNNPLHRLEPKSSTEEFPTQLIRRSLGPDSKTCNLIQRSFHSFTLLFYILRSYAFIWKTRTLQKHYRALLELYLESFQRTKEHLLHFIRTVFYLGLTPSNYKKLTTLDAETKLLL